MKTFKVHMIQFTSHDYYNGADDGFRTYCGITEECSEALFESGAFVENYHPEKTTCKKCLARYEKAIKVENELEQRVEAWAKSEGLIS